MSRVFLFNISASALVFNAPSPSDASMEPEPLTSHTSGALFHMSSTLIKLSQLCLIVHLHFQTLQWNWNHRVLIHQAPCFICHLNLPRPYRSISSVVSVGSASRRYMESGARMPSERQRQYEALGARAQRNGTRG